ncbi:hypothetical protein HYDPIDRAFT_169772 [Hydnomerulius pinastri MD-312]|uniref:Non-specific serine/threonine protein kinase n=1 Tax=Hydnomerulius pinastri MD-312 TaxID=994086 RepID=A0A0C9WC24_9AGAM|nr:hypothetical protein HYDPIDRAFT_169772 [Hydnomerulius pinastri MD-312]
MVVTIELYYDSQAGNHMKPKVPVLRRMVSTIQLKGPSFKIRRKAPPMPPSCMETAIDCGALPVSHDLSEAGSSSDSIRVSMIRSLPPPALMAPVNEPDVAEPTCDAFRNPSEVLDVRGQLNIVAILKEFFARERKLMGIVSPNLAPMRTRWVGHSSEFVSVRLPLGRVLSRRKFGASTTSSSSKANVNVADFEVIRLLGAGANGKVYKVVDQIGGRLFALKVISKSPLEPHNGKVILSEQQAFVRNMGNKHALQLSASFHDGANFYLAMALKVGGDLHEQISTWGRLPYELAKFYAAELMVGLLSLHQRGVLHRDIKPANILIDGGGHVVISDFGLSEVFEIAVPRTNSPYCIRGTTKQLSQAPYLTSGLCGTVSYIAPEIWRNEKYGFAVDYWALAITIHEMLTGEVPWYHSVESTYVDQICHAPLVRDDAMERGAFDLLAKMLMKESKERASYEEMISHSFFYGVDWDLMKGRAMDPPHLTKEELESDVASIDLNAVIVQGEQYALHDDPFPQFTWISPSMSKRRGRALLKKKILGTLRRVRGWMSGRKTCRSRFSETRWEFVNASSDEPVPIQSLKGSVWGVDDDGARGAAMCPSESPRNASLTCPEIPEADPRTEITRNMESDRSLETPTSRLTELSSFLSSVESSRVGTAGSTRSSSSTSLSTPDTSLPCTPGISLGSRTKFQNWVTNLWHPIHAVHLRASDGRKSID